MRSQDWLQKAWDLLWLTLGSIAILAALVGAFRIIDVEISLDSLFWFVLIDIAFLAIVAVIGARASRHLQGRNEEEPEALEAFTVSLGVLPILAQNLVATSISMESATDAIKFSSPDKPNLFQLLLAAIWSSAGLGVPTQFDYLIGLSVVTLGAVLLAWRAADAFASGPARKSAERSMRLHCLAVILYSGCFLFVSVPFKSEAGLDALLSADLLELIGVSLALLAAALVFGACLHLARRTLGPQIRWMARPGGARLAMGRLFAALLLVLVLPAASFGIVWLADLILTCLATLRIELSPWWAALAAPILFLPVWRAFAPRRSGAAAPAPVDSVSAPASPPAIPPSPAAQQHRVGWVAGAALRWVVSAVGRLIVSLGRRIDPLAVPIVAGQILMVILWFSLNPAAPPITPPSPPPPPPAADKPAPPHSRYRFELVPLQCNGLAWEYGSAERVEGMPASCDIAPWISREGMTHVIVIGQSSSDGRAETEDARALDRGRRVAYMLRAPGGASTQVHILNLGKMPGPRPSREQRLMHVIVAYRDAKLRHSLPFVRQLEKAIRDDGLVPRGTLCRFYDSPYPYDAKPLDLSCTPGS